MAKGKSSNKQEVEFDVVAAKKGEKTSAVDFLENNQKLLTNIILGIAVLAGLYFGYKYLYLAPKEREAVNAMYMAEEQFAKDSFALALENPGGGYDGFLGIIDNYGGTKSANLAKYYAGVSYLNLGKYEDAIDYLEKYSAKDDITATMKSGALGDAYAELGDMDKALGLYKKAAGHNNKITTPYYLHKIAMMYYTQGKSEEAVKNLEIIKKDYPDSNQARQADVLLARLQ